MSEGVKDEAWCLFFLKPLDRKSRTSDWDRCKFKLVMLLERHCIVVFVLWLELCFVPLEVEFDEVEHGIFFLSMLGFRPALGLGGKTHCFEVRIQGIPAFESTESLFNFTLLLLFEEKATFGVSGFGKTWTGGFG